MRLLFVRHGEMDRRGAERARLDDVNRVFNQEVGNGLSERGRRQAAQVASYLANRPPHVLLSSPLERARETADIVAARLGMAVEARDELTELRTGHLRGSSVESRLIAAVTRLPVGRAVLIGAVGIPLYYQAWRLGRTGGGESPAHLRDRIDRLFGELGRRFAADAEVALFAHGYLIFHIARHVARQGSVSFLRRPYIPHGGITELQLGAAGRPRLLRYGWTGHLADAAPEAGRPQGGERA
jgi:broad specificity phosphatase PhoE